MFYPLARWIVWGLLRLTFRVRVEGLENLPRQGSLILAANHASYIDPPLLGAATPRRLYFMAKRELFTIPLFGALIRRFGAFPVRRGALDRQAIRSALELLARGEAVVLFPEGTRHRSGGLLPGQQGVAMLASRSGAPIVPVGLVGTRRLFRRLPVPWPERLAVRYGRPIRPEGGPGARREQWGALMERVMREIAALAEVNER